MTEMRRTPAFGLLSVLCIVAEAVLYRFLIPSQAQSIWAPLVLLAVPIAGVVLGMLGRVRKDAMPWLAAVGQIFNALILFAVCLVLYIIRL